MKSQGSVRKVRDGKAKPEYRLEQLRILIRRGSPKYIGAAQALKIVKAIESGASDAEIEAEVKSVPSLAAGIMRLACCAAYAGVEIRSVLFAIELLGHDKLHQMMMTLAISGMTNESGRTGAFKPESFRIRCVSTAFLAEHLAKQNSCDNPDEYYLAGLFADIGYMFMAVHHPTPLLQARVAAATTPNASLNDIEKHCFNFTHAELSSVACEEFSLSPSVVDAVRWHNEPLGASLETLPMADAVCIASSVCDAMNVTALEGLPPVPIDGLALSRLGLKESSIRSMADEMIDRAQHVTGALTAVLAEAA